MGLDSDSSHNNATEEPDHPKQDLIDSSLSGSVTTEEPNSTAEDMISRSESDNEGTAEDVQSIVEGSSGDGEEAGPTSRRDCATRMMSEHAVPVDLTVYWQDGHLENSSMNSCSERALTSRKRRVSCTYLTIRL